MIRQPGDTGKGKDGSEKEHVSDLLSAYIDDGDLDTASRARVQQHLRVCPDCRADYVELVATKRLLNGLPLIPPPRAFTLTPEMVQAPAARRREPTTFWGRLFTPGNTPRFAFGSVVSLALAVLVLLANPLAMGTASVNLYNAPMAAAPFATPSAPNAALSQAPPSDSSGLEAQPLQKSAAAPTAAAGARAAATATPGATSPAAGAGAGSEPSTGDSSNSGIVPPASQIQPTTEPSMGTGGGTAGGVGGVEPGSEPAENPPTAAAAAPLPSTPGADASNSQIVIAPGAVAQTPAPATGSTRDESAPGSPGLSSTEAAGQPYAAPLSGERAPDRQSTPAATVPGFSLGLALGLLSILLAAAAVVSARRNMA